ncbi:MAG: helix-turn-helix domain-containing protein [Methylococcales bacterium]|nr:helix-turn-helix domain-containing protein [Methylococcales bacterium]
MKVHEQIKLFRKLKGWSQEEMADKLEMSINGYGAIERGDADILFTRLKQITEAFGISLVELFGCNEKNVFNALGTNNGTGIQNNNSGCTVNSESSENLQLKYELENQRMLNEQKDKEIELLKEVIVLMKRENI